MFLSRCTLWTFLSAAAVAQFPEPAPVLTTNYTAAPNGPFPKGVYIAFRCQPDAKTLSQYAVADLECLISDGGQISGSFGVQATSKECVVGLGSPVTFGYEKDWFCCMADISSGTSVQISPCAKLPLALIYTIPNPPLVEILPNNTLKAGNRNYFFRAHYVNTPQNPNGHVIFGALTTPYIFPNSEVTFAPYPSYVDVVFRDKTTSLTIPSQHATDGNFVVNFCNSAGCGHSTPVRLKVIYDIPQPPVPEVLPNTTLMAGSDNFIFRFHYPSNFSANPYAYVNYVSLTSNNPLVPQLTVAVTPNGTFYIDAKVVVAATNQSLKASIATEGTWYVQFCNPTGCSAKASFQILVRYNGGWSPWTYDSCKGIDVRSCTNPAPRHGGAECQGQWYRHSTTPRDRNCFVEEGKPLESPGSQLAVVASTKKADSRITANTRFLCAMSCTETPNCMRYTWNKPDNCVLTLRTE